MDRTLAQGRQFLCEDRFTIADIAVVYALWLGRRHKPTLEDEYSPQTKAYLRKMTARPEFIAAIEEEAESLKNWDPKVLMGKVVSGNL